MMHQGFAYTLVRREPFGQSYGTSLRQFRSLRTALAAWHQLAETTDLCLLGTPYFLARGSFLRIDPDRIVQIEAP